MEMVENERVEPEIVDMGFCVVDRKRFMDSVVEVSHIYTDL